MEPKNEMGVIVEFARRGEQYGFEIISIQAAFPDAIIEKDGRQYRVEFEYRSSNFHNHNHDVRNVDLIICWEHDKGCILPVLPLSDPEWMVTDLILPVELEREAAYWRRRAERAEKRLRGLAATPQTPHNLRTNTTASTRDQAAAILAERPKMSGSELGRMVGRSERLGRKLKAELLPVLKDNGSG